MGIIENIRNQVLEHSGYNKRMIELKAERDLMSIIFSQIKEIEKESLNDFNKKLNGDKK